MWDAFQRREINLSRRSSGTYACAAPRCCHERGGLQGERCKCRCNARTTCGSRAAPRDSSLSPAGELYRAQYHPGRTSIFRVHVKSIWSFDIPGCRSGTIASSPCHAAMAWALLSGGSPLEILAFTSKRRAIIHRAPFRAFNCPPQEEEKEGGERGEEKREREKERARGWVPGWPSSYATRKILYYFSLTEQARTR